MRDSIQQRTLYAMVGKRADSLKELGPPDEWQLVESIGEGTYGEVYKARNVVTKEIAAAKVIDSIHEKIEEVLPELAILKKFSNHPNIAGFYGAFIKKNTKRHDQLWFVMELCRGGSVTNLVRSLRKKGKCLDEDVIAYILHESLKGIEHLHRHNIMHRDIKGPNVMLTTDAHIRLIDFGVSAELTNIEMRKNSSVGTPFWMAPEVIACEQQLDYSYDVRCDIWSLGITAIELADGTAPLSDQHPMRALFKIPRSKPPTMKNPERWSHEYRNFIAKCLVKDFEGRPHAQELLRHSFVSWVPGKIANLRRKLKNIMDTQYQGKDGITDEREDRKLSSSLRDSGGNFSATHKSRRDREMLKVDDLATLSSLTEDVILSHLLERYLGSQIYTYIGDILIAVNPQQHLNIYSREYSMMYRNTQKSSLPPHIFMVADMTYQAMINNKYPQCCLISGESGAGKTVSANLLVQQLAELGKAGNRTLEEKILQVNPLMEALGNAQTVINDNSSRFGKYLELHFTSSGALTGGKLTEYLLEKSRVVSQAHGERNFHIFYYMLAGLAYQKKLEKYSFKLYSQHHYLQTGGKNLQDVVCTMGNRKKFEEFQRCFDILGFTYEEVSWLFSILAAIIHIGDIQFKEDESVSHLSDKSMVTNPQLLRIVSSLLGINAAELRDALTTNSNVTRGETIVRNNTVDEAVDCRDGMAKALYGKLFSWIVTRINALLKTEQGLKDDNDYKIGILDIFGFENFKRNSFEQLCINIANEQIQFYFNQQIFSWELEEYRSEGIPFEEISFEDNRPVLDMFLQKPMGLLSLLDEESRFPRASDFTLVEKFNTNLKSPFYERPKEAVGSPTFVIIHYAGRVKYDATNFLEKNRDTLSPDVIHVLRTSENRLVRTLMQYPLIRNDVGGRKTSSHPSLVHVGQDLGKKLPGIFALPESRYNDSSSASKLQQTVSLHFRVSLRDLLSKLLPAESHFVRCVRPNDMMIPGRFDQEKVLTQLRYAGVLETTRIRRQGYSERITFAEFVKRYQVVLYPLHKRVPGDSIACREILKSTKMEKWLIGRSKVFLKYYHVEKLAKMLDAYRRKVITAQKYIRGWLIRRRYRRLRVQRDYAARVIQKYTRGHLARRQYRFEVSKRHWFAIRIQRAFRRYKWRKRALRERERRRRSAIKIQAVVRGFLVRKRFLRIRGLLDRNAAAIQAGYRGYRVRRDFHIIALDQELAKDERRERVAAAIKIQSAYRAMRSRREFHDRKGCSENEDVAAIYFLQQVERSSISFYETQKEVRKVPNAQVVKVQKKLTRKLTQEHMAPFEARDKQEFLDDVGHQQDVQRIYFQQQIERSSTPFFETQKEFKMVPNPHAVRTSKKLVHRLSEDHIAPFESSTTHAFSNQYMPGVARKIPEEASQPLQVRPTEPLLSEVHVQDSWRSQRTFRREIWPAGDESYFKSFVNEHKRPHEGEDQRRRMEMLSILEGVGREGTDGGIRNGQAASVSKPKQVSEYCKSVETKPPKPTYAALHKLDEGRKQYLPVKQVQPVKQFQPTKQDQSTKQVQLVKQLQPVIQTNQPRKLVQTEKRDQPLKQVQPKQLQPLKQVQPVEQNQPVRRVPYKVVSPVQREYGGHFTKMPQKVIFSVNREAKVATKPTPSSTSETNGTAPSKLGYLRHVPSESIHNETDSQQTEQVKLRKPHQILEEADGPSLYSHVLRRTGRRARLGIEDEEQGGVTRINFDRPLVVS